MRFPPDRSSLRRALGSAALIITVAVIVLGNVPGVGWLGDLRAATQPVRSATGLTQNWQVYSPPRTLSAYVDARVDYADGTSSVYSIPGRRGVGAFVDYRWQKYEEAIRPDSGKSLWAGYAEYVADRARAQGKDPVRVTLIRRFANTLSPGPGPPREPWHEYTMFTMAVW
jgi:hypothetical protein